MATLVGVNVTDISDRVKSIECLWDGVRNDACSSLFIDDLYRNQKPRVEYVISKWPFVLYTAQQIRASPSPYDKICDLFTVCSVELEIFLSLWRNGDGFMSEARARCRRSARDVSMINERS